MGIAALLGGLVVIAAIVVGFAWWQGWISIGGVRGPGTSGKGIANGSACKRDRDCASDFCSKTLHRCEAKSRRGDRCSRDQECESASCVRASDRASDRTCK